jgi:hypothetical protein
LRMMREQNDFNAKQAQLQRDWQEDMWNKNNEYNSPEAMISRGLNPFVGSSAGAGVSRSPASGGAVATAAPVPSMQAFKPNFSNVFQSLASLAQARASNASAGESGARANQVDTVTPLLSDYYRGLTNWKNLAIGDSGYWNKTTGRISAALDQSTEAQNLRNAQFAERISAAQETQILLNSEAQRIMNKYMDQNQQADLLIKAQTLANLQSQGALTEKQIQTEIQRAILTAAEASGKKIDNRGRNRTTRIIMKIQAGNSLHTQLVKCRLRKVRYRGNGQLRILACQIPIYQRNSMINTNNHLMLGTTIISNSMTGIRTNTFTSNNSLRIIISKICIKNLININYTGPTTNIMRMIAHIFRSLDTKLSCHLVRIVLTRELDYFFPALEIFCSTN